jgi:hypothetical protein
MTYKFFAGRIHGKLNSVESFSSRQLCLLVYEKAT